MYTGGYARITNSMITNTFIRDIQRNLNKVADLEQQIATGKKINYPSDDPVGADRVLDYRQLLAQAEQYSQNISDADSVAQNIDSALGEMEDLLFRVRDLAVEGANEAPEMQDARDAIAAEIDSLLTELVNQANQKFDGNYLFGGAKTTTTPFTASKSIEMVWTKGNVAANQTYVYDRTTYNAATDSAFVIEPQYTINGTTQQSQAITADDSVKAVLINGKNLVTDLNGSFECDPVTNRVIITDTGDSGISNTDSVELVFDKIVSVKYNGDMGTREIEVGENNRMEVSYVGAVSTDSPQLSLFGSFSADGAESGSVSAFQQLMDLRDSLYKYDRLRNETDGGTNTIGTYSSLEFIQKGVDDVDEILNRITNVRAKQGGIVNRMELAQNRLAQFTLNTTELLSEREDVDMAEAISELVLAQNMYQSALGAGSMIIQTSLLDFLT